MSSAPRASRIPITANRGVTGVLFGLAIITFAIRTYIRIHILKQLSTEDAFLFLAVVCLCISTALTYVGMQDQYDILAVTSQRAEFATLFKLFRELPKISRIVNAMLIFWWCVIFPVKLAFLFFFRRLILRWARLYLWWWCAMVFTVAAFSVSVVASLLTCPYSTTEGMLSCNGSEGFHRVIRDTIITTVMDILTDFVVISFPIAILWHVQIKNRQKAGIGIWLCLSLVMIIIALVRAAGIKLNGYNVDTVWLAFWQQQESSIAVTMVSLSAFRSLFMKNADTPAPHRHFELPETDWGRRPGHKALRFAEDCEASEQSRRVLPQIPMATFSSMADIIQRT